jgi:hypothetical protein
MGRLAFQAETVALFTRRDQQFPWESASKLLTYLRKLMIINKTGLIHLHSRQEFEKNRVIDYQARNIGIGAAEVDLLRERIVDTRRRR